MKVKGLFIATILIVVAATTHAQRVVRKGMKPKTDENATSKVSRGKFSLEQVQGKWQEYKRVDIATDKVESFTDSLMLKIENNKGEVKEGMSMNMIGEVSIDRANTLSIAGDDYTIVSATPNMLELSDGIYLKSMKKVSVFYLETVGKDSIKQVGFTKPDNILLSNLKGKWTVYRREAKPGTITSSTELIKSLSVLKDSTQNIATGEIVMYANDISEKTPCVITVKENTLQVDAGTKQWIFVTYKADNNEFVFGKENEVLNFAKRL